NGLEGLNRVRSNVASVLGKSSVPVLNTYGDVAPSQPMRKGNLIQMPDGKFYNLDGSPVQ
ncbi:MAG: hypothetical protein WAK55_11485, partial [Xanthobacteraceae bacterium]